MIKNKRIIFIFIAIFLFGSYINVNATTNIVYVEGTYQQEKARSMLELINNWRKDTTNNWYYDQDNNKIYPGELKPLTYDYGLEAIAMQRAAEIAVYFQHTRPNGKSITSLTINGYFTRGENIAGGYSVPNNVFTAWQETDEDFTGQGHRRNMLESYYTSIGIGCISVPLSRYRIYCVQEFGAHKNISTTPSEINNEKQKIPVTVDTDVSVSKEDVFLDSNETTIFVEEKTKLPLANAKIYYDDGYTQVTANLNWEITSGSEYISLDGDEVTAKKKGTAVLKGSMGNSSVTYTINVKEIVQVTSISLNKNTIKIEKGEQETLKSTINPTDATNKNVTWTSSNTKVATVDNNGKVTGVSVGESTITVKTNNNKTATCKVTVVKNPQKILYTTHVQNIGWQKYVKNGEMAGTSGRSLRLEGNKNKTRKSRI